MFEKKRCKVCQEKVKDDWNFCPNCGEDLKNRRAKSLFDNMATKPTFKMKLPMGGISIMVSPGFPEKVPYKVSRQQPKKMGYKILKPDISKPRVKIPAQKMVVEPDTKVESFGDRKVILIKLPGVKEGDIEIKELEQSMEIKAFAGDKAYFKVIPLKDNASIMNEEFKDGVLRLEVQG
jgi:HSP20 family molecular chaperone IbpA